MRAHHILFLTATVWLVNCSGSDPAPNNITPDSGSLNDSNITQPDSAQPDSVQTDGPADSASTCSIISANDDPDDDFVDSNCDGIDGNKSQAIFVSPIGSDAANGTMDAPVKPSPKGFLRPKTRGFLFMFAMVPILKIS